MMEEDASIKCFLKMGQISRRQKAAMLKANFFRKSFRESLTFCQNLVFNFCLPLVRVKINANYYYSQKLMNPPDPELEVCEIVQVSWLDRWQVYKRLQELEIPCWCGVDQPLRAQINTVKQAAQLISVLKQVSASRAELAEWLEGCWQIGENQSFERRR